MNAIQKFAEEHGADVGHEFEKGYQDAVQSVIGDKGTAINAWWYDNTEYVDWWSEVRGIEGMAPNTYIVVVLSTDVSNGSQWLSVYYRDEEGNDLCNPVDGGTDNFDPLPLIDKVLKKGESKKSEAAEVKDKQYYLDMFDAAYKECCQLAKEDGIGEENWAEYFATGNGNSNTFSQKEADEIVGYYMEFHPEGVGGDEQRPYTDWVENMTLANGDNPPTALDKEITRILKALYAPNESKKHICSMQKKKESLLAKKNESVSLPQDVKDAMKKVQAFLKDNYTEITNSGLVSDEDCSVGYQLDCTLNVLGDVVANFPKG